MSGYRLVHDPAGWACNQGWAVLDTEGRELYRGPEWAARLRVERPELLHAWPARYSDPARLRSWQDAELEAAAPARHENVDEDPLETSEYPDRYYAALSDEDNE